MLLLCQACLIVLALYLSMLVAFEFFTSASSQHRNHYPNYAIILVAGLMIESLTRDPGEEAMMLFRRRLMEQHSLSLRQTIFSAGLLFLYLAAVKDAYVSRTVLVLALPLFYCALLLSNTLLPRLLAKHFFAHARTERALLVGTPTLAKRLLTWLREKELFGFRTIGLLSEQSDAECGTQIPRLGGPEDLERVLHDEQISQVIFLGLPASAVAHQHMVGAAEKCGARVLILNDLEERLRHRIVHLQDGGVSFIAPRMEPLEDPLHQLTKRALDIAVAIPAVALVCPLVAMLFWILHRWQSPGPLFFRQVRAGIQNRKFTIWKFRSMHTQESIQAREAFNERRVFPAGHWLRRLSLDELPQFFNVLIGDMSVCGPRPHLIEHNDTFAQKMSAYHLRAFVKPGVTGLAQVRGFRGDVRSVENIEHRLESDIAYIENWRLLLDVAIIFRTALQVVLFTVDGLFCPRQRLAHETASLPLQRFAKKEPVRRAYLTEATRRSFRRILGINFFTGDAYDAVSLGMEGGLVVAPSAPVLLGLEKDPAQRAAVCESALAITDSGFMVLLWKLLTGEAITRVSGLAYLQLLLKQPALKTPGATFWVMPTKESARHHAAWLETQGFHLTKDDIYVAPHFESAYGFVEDSLLVERVQLRRPTQVIMAIGGGVQEKLGAFLLRQLDYVPAVHCTGAAIGFLSGEQAKIPNWADQFRLGWFYRCLHEPGKFVPRYWEARKLLRLMLHYHGRVPGPESSARESHALDVPLPARSLLTVSASRVSTSP